MEIIKQAYKQELGEPAAEQARPLSLPKQSNASELDTLVNSSTFDLRNKRQELEETIEQARYELDEEKVQQEMLLQRLHEGEST